MLLHPELGSTYEVRRAAPEVFLFANLGAVQLAGLSVGAVREVVAQVAADALCVHFEPRPGDGPAGYRGRTECRRAAAATARSRLIAPAASVPPVMPVTISGALIARPHRVVPRSTSADRSLSERAMDEVDVVEQRRPVEGGPRPTRQSPDDPPYAG